MEHTPALTFALKHAQVLAQRQGAAQVDPLHLLLGLLHEEEGRPALLLAEAGLDPKRVQPQLADFAGSSTAATDTPLPVSREITFVLRQARELARAHSAEGTVTSDQVLLVLLREEVGLRGSLESLGLRFAALEEKVLGQQAINVRLDETIELGGDEQQIDTARILDANANRAREALRVIEDYCRFVLNDALLSRELKQLRHDFAACLDQLPAGLLYTARDTLQDVGTAITTDREMERESLFAVVEANYKRLEEALRSLEEFGKLHSVAFAASIEGLRYRCYSLEAMLLGGARAREQLAGVQLCVLATEAICRASLLGTVAEALAGGAQMIQLREKQLSDGDLLKLAREVRKRTRRAGALFIVNDRPDIARLCDADGVHLGQDDLPVHAARRIVGAGALIGVSTHNLEQVQQAVRDGASYLGVGPTFPSTTKAFAEFPGLEFVRQALAETSLPAFAIGGVNADNLEQVLAAGAVRVAVSQAICAAEDARKATADMHRRLTAAFE